MNIRNVTMLAEMLSSLGFESKIGYELMKRASFLPDSFLISQHMQKGNDVITFHISFERKDADYHLKYYDASLRKAVEIPEAFASLDKIMSSIDWHAAFSVNADGKFDVNDADTWKHHAEVAAIISEINSLEDHEAAGKLRVKFWADIKQDMFNLSTLRSRLEISQRFYFFEDQGCIGADEAYRFLHNRWMEKQMLAKRKSEAGTEAEKSAEKAGSKLLTKRKGVAKKRILL